MIVQVGSALAYRSIPLQSAYCAAKAAIRGFTDSVRSELIHDGSRVHLTMVQMPGLNTPQFQWGLSRMQHKARPVAPAYQPEVAAEAIVWSAHHRRRELWVGLSTVEAIRVNQVSPGFGDWYAAQTAYQGQQTGEPEDPGRPHNLWKPVDREGDFGRTARSIPRRGDTARSYGPTRTAAGWRWPPPGSRASPAASGSPRVRTREGRAGPRCLRPGDASGFGER